MVTPQNRSVVPGSRASLKLAGGSLLVKRYYYYIYYMKHDIGIATIVGDSRDRYFFSINIYTPISNIYIYISASVKVSTCEPRRNFFTISRVVFQSWRMTES